jgi:hypothetical protein
VGVEWLRGSWKWKRRVRQAQVAAAVALLLLLLAVVGVLPWSLELIGVGGCVGYCLRAWQEERQDVREVRRV